MKHIDRLVRFVKSAGAASEAATDRNGFLSYHAETHAVGLGVAAGFAAVAWGRESLLSLVYAAAVHGRVGQSDGKRRRVVKDCRQEPHYCLGGIVMGALLAAWMRVWLGKSLLPFA